MRNYQYYKLDDSIPCRIKENDDGSSGAAELYKSGTGFLPGPALEIEFEGIPISKQDFDAMIVAIDEKRARAAF